MTIAMDCSRRSGNVVTFRVSTINAKSNILKTARAPPTRHVTMEIYAMIQTGVMKGCADTRNITELSVVIPTETASAFWPRCSMTPVFQQLTMSVIRLDVQFLELTVAKSIAPIFVSVWTIRNVIDTTPAVLDGDVLLIILAFLSTTLIAKLIAIVKENCLAYVTIGIVITVPAKKNGS